MPKFSIGEIVIHDGERCEVTGVKFPNWRDGKFEYSYSLMFLSDRRSHGHQDVPEKFIEPAPEAPWDSEEI